MDLIYRTGQPTKRRFFFRLLNSIAGVYGNEAPACMADMDMGLDMGRIWEGDLGPGFWLGVLRIASTTTHPIVDQIGC